MESYYERPSTGHQNNPYNQGTANHEQFRWDSGQMREDENRWNNNVSYSGGGGLPAGAAAAGLLAGFAVVAVWALCLYWFYTKTAIGRKIFQFELKIWKVLGGIMALIYILPVVMGSLAFPLLMLWDPAETMEEIEGLGVAIFLMLVLYAAAYSIRRWAISQAAVRVPSGISATDPMVFFEGSTTYRFNSSTAVVNLSKDAGTEKKPKQEVRITENGTTRTINVRVSTPLQVGTVLGLAWLSGYEADPLLVHDATIGKDVLRLEDRPWIPNMFKRRTLAAIAVPLAVWFLGFGWDLLAMNFGSRVIAIVALGHALLGFSMAFRVPNAIREMLSSPADSVSLYKGTFFPALAERTSNAAYQHYKDLQRVSA